MSNKYSETTIKSYSERIKSGFAASIFGMILFALSFVVLFMNEGSSIKNEKMLKSGLENVISIPSESIHPQNENKLVHLIAQASSSQQLTDNNFRIDTNAIKLKRNVEMYQWKEYKNEDSHVSAGGSETTTTTYEYKKVWSKDRIDSNDFRVQKYSNPYPLFSSETMTNNEISVGEFLLSSNHIKRFNEFIDFKLENTQNLPENFTLVQNFYTNSKNISTPELGDLKITYEYIPLQTVSVIGKQSGNKIVPFSTEYGDIVISQTGEHSAYDMFSLELKKNQILTWVIRLVGFLMMFIGLRMMVGIVGIIVSVLPFLQPTFSFISTPIIFLFSLCVSILTIAISWLFYRPLISVLLFVAIYFIWKKLREVKAKKKKEIEDELLREKQERSPLSQMVENSYSELEKKANDTKDKIKNIISKFK